jgi:hypothetical protein
MEIHSENILKALEQLRTAEVRPEVFGSDTHEFEINPPVSEARLQEFKGRHGIHLPEDYRGFLLHVGNGGAGPYYGLFALGETDGAWENVVWEDHPGFVGDLAVPFPHTEAWNDLDGEPEYDGTKEEEYERQLDIFEARYFSPRQVAGAVPICHLGCNLRQWLVVKGPERGHVWCDDRADHEGLSPLQTPTRARVTFMEWYLEWLNEALANLHALGIY